MKSENYIIGSLTNTPTFSLAGEVHVPAPNKHFQRSSEDWILYIITDGRMKITEVEKQYTLTAGDIMIFSPGKHHFGHPVNERIDYYYIHFFWNGLHDISMSKEQYIQHKTKRHQISSIHSEFSEPFLLPKYFHPSQTSFNEILEQTHLLLKNSTKDFIYQKSKNNALLLLLLILMAQTEFTRILYTESSKASLPLLILDFLKINYSNKITSTLLEQHFHHNFDYMNRRFKQYTGTTIFAFLEKYRIEQGKKLLKSQQFTISEIADSLGFCNAFYFSKVFKKHEHITPKEYQHI